MTLDRIVETLVGLGIPGLLLLLIIFFVGPVGAAALTTALAALGGPLGMLGGIAVLLLLTLVSKGLATYGIEKIFRRVVDGLREKGTTKEEVLAYIERLKISRTLKLKLRTYILEHWCEALPQP